MGIVLPWIVHDTSRWSCVVLCAGTPSLTAAPLTETTTPLPVVVGQRLAIVVAWCQVSRGVLCHAVGVTNHHPTPRSVVTSTMLVVASLFYSLVNTPR